ncbi:YbhB/YbcL family Raf kinase inhibitor-like protein [Erythrobacter sp. LQ02-29]|uniref:YbhB/YbcL family Raf kinase inhibitor-like protein n=1 Tax=Erythrobacter sp. LQ02-29 TaxID=2920384 RepID=UPI001F4EC46A|nr:YbhB/YbcL family Raf kinase inhibitor-like protein [Erythrobacter sp. LQ02-29]MCP9221308.1 YbhB/YbcL family Raf kinase inhibitor-like protein [Erythrobacter sp. LQ02-29]
MADWLKRFLPENCPPRASLALARFAAEAKMNRGGFAISSAAFENGGELDPSFTAEEEDAVAPPMEWTAPPPGTQELVLVVEDASTDPPDCHWLVWGLPGQRAKLLEGEAPPRTGKNARGNSDWLLPALTEEGWSHWYVFQLFALDLPLTLMPGASKEELFAEIDGHVIAATVTTASFRPTAEEDWVEDDFEEP